MKIDSISRRQLLAAGVMFAASGAAKAGQGPAAGLLPTAGQDLGPFYPVERPLDQDSDLTRQPGSSGRASGTIINVVGRVLDRSGRPVSGARIDLWQANAAGRYRHPADTSEVPLDPHFGGSAVVTTDADGAFRFRTVKPGAYQIGPDLFRTPHIHLDVTGRRERLTTQMYFPGEALNDVDILLRNAAPRESVMSRSIAALPDDPDVAAFGWDIVLAVG